MSSRGITIAISGRSGCGNTTVSRLLAQRLNLALVNYTFKSIAKEEQISFEEVCRRAELSDEYDHRVDRIQVERALMAPSVLGTRLAIWMLSGADLKVYLTGSPETRAKRIQAREGGTLDEQIAATAKRDKRDSLRYQRLYGIDMNDNTPADLVVNTDRFGADQVVDIIEAAALAMMKK